MTLNPFLCIDLSISDSLRSVRKSVLIYETIIQLIEIVEKTLEMCQEEEEINSLTHSYTSMLFDISNMHGSKREKLWEFTREELHKLLELEAKLLKMNKQSANIRPVKGVLMEIKLNGKLIIKCSNCGNQYEIDMELIDWFL